MDHILVPGIEIGGIFVLYCYSVFIYWYSLISMNDTNVLNLVLFFSLNLVLHTTTTVLSVQLNLVVPGYPGTVKLGSNI
eukprot:SAG11_NODE_242_length_11757_cov_9.613999_6_plen_79_part_00